MRALSCVSDGGIFCVRCICLKVRALSCVSCWGYVSLVVCLPEGSRAVVCLAVGGSFVCGVFA